MPSILSYAQDKIEAILSYPQDNMSLSPCETGEGMIKLYIQDNSCWQG